MLKGSVGEDNLALNFLPWAGYNGGVPGAPTRYRIQRRLVRGGEESFDDSDVKEWVLGAEDLFCDPSTGACPQGDGWRVRPLARGAVELVQQPLPPFTTYMFRVAASNGQGVRTAPDPRTRSAPS